MGSFCSKPGNYSGGDAVVSSRTRVRGGQQLGESVAQRPDPRAAAAEAAEQRRKAVRSLVNLYRNELEFKNQNCRHKHGALLLPILIEAD